MASHMLRSIIFAEKLLNSSLSRLIVNVSTCRIGLHTTFFLTGPKGTIIKMPALSPTMTEGTIVKWLKKEGDSFQPGDALCDIQTDKAVISMEVDDQGVLAKILMPDDSKDVKIGSPIAVMVEEGEDWKSVEIPTDLGVGPAPSAPLASAPTPSAPQAAVSGGPVGTVLKMPSLSPTMTEGTIVKWLLKEGDKFNPGDAICEIQTDKAVVAMEVDEEGILAKILLPEDSKDIKIGSPIALMVAEGEEWRGVQMPADVETAAPPAAKAPEPKPPSPAAVAVPVTPALSVGPAVRNLLLSFNLTAESIPATGPHGKLLKGDVLKYIETKQLKPVEISSLPPPSTKPSPVPSVAKGVPRQPGAAFTDIPHTSMRRTIAKRLTESKTMLPHAYATVDCYVDSVHKLRSEMKEQGKTVSVNDFIIKAAAMALQRVPNVNVTYSGQETKILSNVDISVAVATEAGLITPIVKNALALSIEDISKQIRDLAKRAKEGKLKPDEFMGGTFTISNLGMFGINQFSAIINPPQCAILAIGTSRLTLSQAGIKDSDQIKFDKRNTVVPRLRMTATLSYDARAIDEDAAAEFLHAFRSFIETPGNLTFGSPLHGSDR